MPIADASQELIQRYEETRLTVEQLAVRHGRETGEVRIIAVSKLHPASRVAALAEQGQRDFGENYIQEALHKQSEVASENIRWHFMGQLQRNKAKFIPGHFALLHSLDSQRLAQDLHKHAQRKGIVQDVLVQINFEQEQQKGGVAPESAQRLAEDLLQLSGLRMRGLMTLPPFDLVLDQKQKLFARMRELRDAVQQCLGLTLPELSMGTTDDFPRAIAEGATMVRIGTRIFGPRPR
jgi:PLP dependent protein